MKQISKNICLILLYLICMTQCRSLNSNKAACSISSISIPIGSSSPVMVYNARMENENLELTVLDKEHVDKYKVDVNLFYSDKKSGESWYANKNVLDKNFESMRDAFSLCRTLNTDNKQTKIYEKSRLYSIYRTEVLPTNLALRVSQVERVEGVEQKSTSFLQMKMKQSMLDRQMERELDELDSDESPDFVAEQYKKLNNDANVVNERLQNQLAYDNGVSSHSIADLYVD